MKVCKQTGVSNRLVVEVVVEVVDVGVVVVVVLVIEVVLELADVRYRLLRKRLRFKELSLERIIQLGGIAVKA